MIINRFIKVILLLLGGVFIVLQGLAYESEGAAVSALMLILLTVLYCVWTPKKSRLFFWFLVVSAMGYLLGFLSWYMPRIEEGGTDYYYYGSNILFIISYLFLIIKIVSSFKLKEVFKGLAIPIIILLILDVFCVVLVSETTEAALTGSEYALEYVYNAVIMALLSVALIDYMYRNDTKSMLFLVGSICIVFSEIIQLAYYYILEDNSLGFVYSLFLVVAFLFFYLQSQLDASDPEPFYMDEQLEV
ncbi:hypothetical protein [Winogradskyella sp.]|uniref:hypothetical protein n=3 Tax=Winogradskyella sp. TaxID=1883156 RepID=UPI0035198248